MVVLKKVIVDDLYETIHSFVQKNELVIKEYPDMIDAILSMIREGYCFTMDRDILSDAMECLTYMYSPDDDMNKDKIIQQITQVSDDDMSDDDDEEMPGDMLSMMKMLGMNIPPTKDDSVSNEDEDKEDEVKESEEVKTEEN